MRRATVSVAVWLAWMSTARATTESFPDFKDISPLTLSGSARQVTTADGSVLRLTPAVAYQSGSAFGTVTISAAQFYTSFAFRLSNPGGNAPDPNGRLGADGITFAIQGASASLGSQGGGLGIENVKPSVAIEFDTYKNVEYMDHTSNHVGIDINGVVASVVTADVTTPFNDGNIWYAWIDCDSSTITVSVSQDGIRPAVPQLSYPIDVEQTIGAKFAYVGFTAATGGGFQTHDILSWVYLDHFVSADAGAPSPDAGDTFDAGAEDVGPAGDGRRDDASADGPPSGSTDAVSPSNDARDGSIHDAQADAPGKRGGCGCAAGGGGGAGAPWLAAAVLLALRARRRAVGRAIRSRTR